MSNIEIEKKVKELILVRGAPGSGKSTFAKKLGDEFNYAVQENDSFFTDKDGNYNFDIKYHQHAKDVCVEKTKESLSLGKSTVVANTFTTLKEMEPYFELAQQKRISVRVVEMELQYDNVHSVPDFVVKDKIEKFEKYEGAEVIKNSDYSFVNTANLEEKPKARKIKRKI